MSNYSQSPIKSNKMSGNSSYATQNANSNGSHEKVGCRKYSRFSCIW